MMIETEEACTALCDFCAGKHNDTEIKPFRVAKDEYFSNYGEVPAGNWLHPTTYGNWHTCQAGKLLEYLFQKQGEKQ